MKPQIQLATAALLLSLSFHAQAANVVESHLIYVQPNGIGQARPNTNPEHPGVAIGNQAGGTQGAAVGAAIEVVAGIISAPVELSENVRLSYYVSNADDCSGNVKTIALDHVRANPMPVHWYLLDTLDDGSSELRDVPAAYDEKIKADACFNKFTRDWQWANRDKAIETISSGWAPTGTAAAKGPTLAGIEFGWPVKGTSNKPAENGKGIDIFAPAGDIVSASADGTVVSAVPTVVVINHTGKTFSSYQRLQNVSVKAGDKVTKGQAIGQVGACVDNAPPLLRFNIAVAGAKTDLLEVLPK